MGNFLKYWLYDPAMPIWYLYKKSKQIKKHKSIWPEHKLSENLYLNRKNRKQDKYLSIDEEI